MSRRRAPAHLVAWMLAGGVLLVVGSAPLSLRAQQPRVREVHLVRQAGNEDQPLAFSPAELTVSAGTTVRWVNDADVFHTVTFAQSAAVRLPSGVFEATFARAGETAEFRFDTPGDYAYYCEPHVEFMAGIVRARTAARREAQGAARLPATGMRAPAMLDADNRVGEAALLLAGVALLAVPLAVLLWRCGRAAGAEPHP